MAKVYEYQPRSMGLIDKDGNYPALISVKTDFVLKSDYDILYKALSEIERVTHRDGRDYVYRIACNAMFGIPAPASGDGKPT